MSKMKFKDILYFKDGIIRGPFGGDIKKEYFVQKDKSTYKVYEQSVVYNKNVSSGSYYINEERYNKLKKFSVKAGDLLLTGAGTLGKLYEIPDKYEPGIINQALLRIRLNEDIIDKTFFKYYFKWYIKDIVCRINGDSVIPNLPPISVLKETNINIPNINIQKQIGDILQSIDNKINNNININYELESMAKTIYDYWFLQFEFPNKEGKPYKSSGGKMIWNKELKKEIPEGWKVEYLREKFTLSRGISYTSKEIETGNGIPMINLACINTNRNYRDGELKYYNGKISNTALLSGGDLLVACTDLTRNADIVGSPILTPYDNTYTYSMDMAKLIPSEKYFNKYYLYMTLRTDFYHNYIKKWASGTNVLHLNLDGINWFKTWIPPMNIQNKYSKIIEDINKKENLVLVENEELISLRDFLLPMLMNGQVGFKD